MVGLRPCFVSRLSDFEAKTARTSDEMLSAVKPRRQETAWARPTRETGMGGGGRGECGKRRW